MKKVECAGFYPIVTPSLYIYYSQWTKDVGDVQQRTYNQAAQRKFILLGIPVFIGVVRWGT